MAFVNCEWCGGRCRWSPCAACRYRRKCPVCGIDNGGRGNGARCQPCEEVLRAISSSRGRGGPADADDTARQERLEGYGRRAALRLPLFEGGGEA